MKKLTGMNETLDEIMIMVAKEANYTMADLMGMDIFRFLRVVDRVKQMIRVSNGNEMTEPAEDGRSRSRSRQVVKY